MFIEALYLFVLIIVGSKLQAENVFVIFLNNESKRDVDVTKGHTFMRKYTI